MKANGDHAINTLLDAIQGDALSGPMLNIAKIDSYESSGIRDDNESEKILSLQKSLDVITEI